jgi:hypothetical protein
LPTSSALRAFAEDPPAYGEIDPRSGLERVLTDEYCLLIGPVPSFTQVSRLRLDPDTVAETIHEIRAEVTRRAHRRATWSVTSSAAPGDLVDRLYAHGFVAEDHYGALVLTAEPPTAPGGVTARRVADFAEFKLASELSRVAFGNREERAAEWDAIAESQFALERAGHGPRVYLVFVDGRPVGSGLAVFEDGLPAGILVGGGIVADARGRGAYRALVRARWDDALASGFDALCVHGGPMSRPILERLGFECVAEIELLLDPATC